MLLCIAKGMCELHSLNVIHYDLRPANVLLKKVIISSYFNKGLIILLLRDLKAMKSRSQII